MEEREDASDAAEAADEQPEARQEEDHGDEEGEVRGLRDPAQPTREERARHELTHLPFRTWCRHCVAGKAADDPHERGEPEEEGGLPKSSIDYGSIKLADEDGGRTVIIYKAKPKGAVGAKCVAAKGREDPRTTPWIVEQLRRGGAGRCVLQSDGEPATRAVVRDVIEEACATSSLGVACAHSAAYDPRSNGVVERAVREVKDHIRVLHCALTDKIGPLPTSAAAFDWLVAWAAELLTGAQIGKDGMTAFRRMMGKPWNPRVAAFGEQVMARRPRALEQAGLEPRWDQATYLGTRWGTIDHYVADSEGHVYCTRTIRRIPEDQRWDGNRVRGVTGVPDDHDRDADPEVPQPVAPAVAHPPEDPEILPKRIVRGFHIKKTDMIRHGYSKGCPRCEGYRTNRVTGVNHTEACRERFRQIFEDADDGRVDRARQRQGGIADGPAAADEMEQGEPHDEQHRDPQADDDARLLQPEVPQPRLPAGQPASSSAAPPAPQPDALAGPGMEVDAQEEMVVDMIIKGAAHDLKPAEEVRRLCLIRGDTGAEAGRRVVELFSRPRVNLGIRHRQAAQDPLPVTAGTSFDLVRDTSTGESWNFCKPEDRRRCWRRLEEEQPWLVIGSPPCTAFSALNAGLNYPRMDPTEVARRQAEGRLLLGFAASVYRWQIKRGAYFLHEHPASASSWKCPEIQSLQAFDTVQLISSDMCLFGMVATAAGGEVGPVKKPTKWLGNIPRLMHELNRRCRGDHEWHVPLMNGRAAKAAVYPPGLVSAIMRGIQAQVEEDERVKSGSSKSVKQPSIAPELQAAFGLRGTDQDERPAFDEYTFEELPPELVAEGKKVEMEFLSKKRVWRIVPRPRGAKVVGTRWAHCNKGDSINPEIRCRLVVQEVGRYATDEFYAATPPIEAVKLLTSMAAESPELEISLVDISRAYFNANINRTVYVELPPEAGAPPGSVGVLEKCMYGTRDAAQGWETAYCTALKRLGFVRGIASPCLFIHPTRNVKVCVHGDDFLSVGSKADNEWFRSGLLQEFEGKLKGVLKAAGDEVRVLNRILRRTAAGYEWEADQRHGEIIVRELGLTEDSKELTVPGRKLTKAELDGDEEELSAAEHSRYRALVARANFLSTDRPDVAFAVKELCRRMSAPTGADWLALKRLGRYLKGKPRMISYFPWQDASPLTVLTDSDWAGCPRTRRSTSGGLIMRGCHTLRHWCHTQPTVALSSAEAELMSLVRGASEALGLRSLSRDVGVDCNIHILTDASAAIGMCKRTGVGKVRHLDTRLLWIQDKVRCGDLSVDKVSGLLNPADALTKHLGSEMLMGHMERMSHWLALGRASSAPQLS